jgi:nucleoside-diphosphate-sugar epimerase
MKILITGGLGHIGSYIIENINKIKILKKIYIIDNLSTQRYCSLFNLPKTKKKFLLYRMIYHLKMPLIIFKKLTWL